MKSNKFNRIKLNIFIWVNRLLVFTNLLTIVYLVFVNKEIENNGGLFISSILLIAIGNYLNDFFYSFMTEGRTYFEYKDLLLNNNWKYNVGYSLFLGLWLYLIYITVSIWFY